MTNKKKTIKSQGLFPETQRLIKKIQASNKNKILCYWTSFNGSICQNDVISFYEIIKDWPIQDKIYLFIKSDGGDGKESLRIINLLREHTKKLIVLVRGECSSAATIMALGSDEIHRGPLAFLSAADTSLTHDLSPIFFQAEDGIRDTSVTGVQTCALPICGRVQAEEFILEPELVLACTQPLLFAEPRQRGKEQIFE